MMTSLKIDRIWQYVVIKGLQEKDLVHKVIHADMVAMLEDVVLALSIV